LIRLNSIKSVWNLPTIVGGTRIIYNIGFIMIYNRISDEMKRKSMVDHSTKNDAWLEMVPGGEKWGTV